MKPATSATFALSYFLFVLCLGCSKASIQDEVTSVEVDEAEMKASVENQISSVKENAAEMEAAIAAARAKLQEFWNVFKLRPNGESDFSLKVHMTDGDASEDFWLTHVERIEDKIYGTINDEPKFLKSVKFGQRIEVPEENISDWRYMRNNKMMGNFTEGP